MRTPEDPAGLGIDLAPGERTIWAGRPTLRGHLWRSLPLVGLQAGGFVVFVIFATFIAPSTSTSVLLTFAIPVAAIIVLGVLIRALGALRTHYALSDARLYVRDGLLRRRTIAIRPSALPSLEIFAALGDVGSIGYRLDREAAPKAPPVGPLARVVLLDGIPEAGEVLRRLEAMRREAVAAASVPGGIGAVPKAVVGSAGSWFGGLRGATIVVGAFFIGLSLMMLVSLGVAGALVVGWPISAGATAFLAIGVGIVGYQVRAIRRERRILATGQRVIGTVTAISRGNAEVNDQPTYEIRYRYEVLGRPYEGKVGGLSYAAAHRVGIGDALVVAVDPAAPAASVLAFDG